jgi:hypothetical protein
LLSAELVIVARCGAFAGLVGRTAAALPGELAIRVSRATADGHANAAPDSIVRLVRSRTAGPGALLFRPPAQ